MKLIFILLLPVTGLLSISSLNNSFIITERSNACSLKDTTEKEIITKTKGYEAKTTGISFARIETYIDSSYYPRSLYYNIRFAEVLGTTIYAVSPGKLIVELWNEKKENVSLIKEPKFYAAKTFKEGQQINVLFSIPLNPTDVNNKKYSYSLSFETSTGKRIITMSGKVGYK
jgi:hypothetical protein